MMRLGPAEYLIEAMGPEDEWKRSRPCRPPLRHACGFRTFWQSAPMKASRPGEVKLPVPGAVRREDVGRRWGRT